MSVIHPLAVVDPKAQLGEDCEVGPFCVIGPDVVMGRGNKLLSHVVLSGHTTVGSGNLFHPNCVIGGPPQDKKYRGEATGVNLGDNNIIREAVTINCGTLQDLHSGGITRLGDNNLLMTNVHLGHDCRVGSHNVLANNVMLAGHVHIGSRVILNGAVGVNQFVTIGDFAYIAGAARIHHDVPPYVKVTDDDLVRALNDVGLRRAGVSAEAIEELEAVFRKLFMRKRTSLASAMAAIDLSNGTGEPVKTLVEFLRRRDTGKNGRYLEGLRAAAMKAKG